MKRNLGESRIYREQIFSIKLNTLDLLIVGQSSKRAFELSYFRIVHVEDERENTHQISASLNICSKSFSFLPFLGCSCKDTKWASVATEMSCGRMQDRFSMNGKGTDELLVTQSQGS